MITVIAGSHFHDAIDPETSFFTDHVARAGSLTGTVTVTPFSTTIAESENTTFFAQVSAAHVSQGISILPDMSGYDDDRTSIMEEVHVSQATLFRVGSLLSGWYFRRADHGPAVRQ